MGCDATVLSLGVKHHRQGSARPKANQAVQDFSNFVGVRLHWVAIVSGFHVNVDA